MKLSSFLYTTLLGLSSVLSGSFREAQAAGIYPVSKVSIFDRGYVDLSEQLEVKTWQNDNTGQIVVKVSNNGNVSSDWSIMGFFLGNASGVSDFTYEGYSSPGEVVFSKRNISAPSGYYDWTTALKAENSSGSGINAGEFAKFQFSGDFANFQTGLNSGSLAVALYVENLNGDKAYVDYYATSPDVDPATIPEPITLLGTGAAIGFGILLRSKQAKLKA